MSQKDIEQFFDNLAPKWDGMEIKKDEDILPLLQEIGIKEGDEILDLGCGTGRITSLLHSLSNGNVLGIDISSNMIDIAKKKYEGKDYASFAVGDFISYKFDKKFDFVVIYNAFPHFLDKEGLKVALANVLKDGGRIAIIHSLSRFQLSKAHSSCNMKTTRNLLSPAEEGQFFADLFDINIAKETDNSYMIVATKR